MCIYTLANIRLIQPIVNILTKTSSFFFFALIGSKIKTLLVLKESRGIWVEVCVYTLEMDIAMLKVGDRIDQTPERERERQ